MLYSNEMICKLRVSVGILIEPKSPRCIQLILGKQKRNRLCIALVCISRSVQVRLNCQIWPRINPTFEWQMERNNTVRQRYVIYFVADSP